MNLNLIRYHIISNWARRVKMTDRPWYTPAGALCRISKSLALWLHPDEKAAAFLFLYGAIDILGVKGTMQYILKMRKDNAANQIKDKKSAVPRVRHRG